MPSETKASEEIPEILTTKELSKITGWSITAIARWAQEGQIPYIRKVPGRTGSYLFDRDSVLRRLRRRDEVEIFRPYEDVDA